MLYSLPMDNLSEVKFTWGSVETNIIHFLYLVTSSITNILTFKEDHYKFTILLIYAGV